MEGKVTAAKSGGFRACSINSHVTGLRMGQVSTYLLPRGSSFILRCRYRHPLILVDMLSQTLCSCLVGLTSKVAVFALPCAPYNQMGNCMLA